MTKKSPWRRKDKSERFTAGPKVVYTDKFIISNIDLTNIDLATDEDKKYGIDKWARFFKAKTWEEMHMLAEKDKTMDRAISGIWQLTEEEMIQEQCRAREEWIINDNRKNEIIEQQKEALAQIDEELAKYKARFGEI